MLQVGERLKLGNDGTGSITAMLLGYRIYKADDDYRHKMLLLLLLLLPPLLFLVYAINSTATRIGPCGT